MAWRCSHPLAGGNATGQQMSMSSVCLRSRTLRRAMQIALVAACTALCAQEKPRYSLPRVTVKGTSSDPVEKSYRKMVQGMDYFERERAAFAPNASLRFKLLPRKPGTDMDHIVLEVIGFTFVDEVPIAPDHTFVLKRDLKALQEDAVVSPNRKRLDRRPEDQNQQPNTLARSTTEDRCSARRRGQASPGSYLVWK